MVARLSVDTMEKLRSETLTIISRMKTSKSKILRSVASSSDRFDTFFDESELLWDEVRHVVIIDAAKREAS